MNINSPAITIAETLLGITAGSQDEMLLVLGGIAETDALTYTSNEAILFEYDILARMMVYLYNQRGNEGLASQTMATVSETYTAGSIAYPVQIITALRGFRLLKTL